MKKKLLFKKAILFAGLFSILIPSFSSAQNSSVYDQFIDKYTKQYGVDKNLVKSLIEISSGGNPKAVSASGAAGLMQLAPSVVKSLGIANALDPEENIKGGCAYLKNIFGQFTETELAVAAFNAGPGEVKKYGKIPPFAETKRFVEEVMKKYKILKEKEPKLKLFGSWNGTGKFTKYVSNPPLDVKIVGSTQPFDLEIIPEGSGVRLRTSQGPLGEPSLYFNVLIEEDRIHVEYKGPNPFGKPIPNTQTTYTMNYVLDLKLSNGILKGEFSSVQFTKMIFLVKELNMPEQNAEISYSMDLTMNKK